MNGFGAIAFLLFAVISIRLMMRKLVKVYTSRVKKKKKLKEFQTKMEEVIFSGNQDFKPSTLFIYKMQKLIHKHIQQQFLVF